jgi:hypothetical protein
MRRAAWNATPALLGGSVLFVAGAGTERAVAVWRQAGVDTVVDATRITAADQQADDWEVAP